MPQRFFRKADTIPLEVETSGKELAYTGEIYSREIKMTRFS